MSTPFDEAFVRLGADPTLKSARCRNPHASSHAVGVGQTLRFRGSLPDPASPKRSPARLISCEIVGFRFQPRPATDGRRPMSTCTLRKSDAADRSDGTPFPTEVGQGGPAFQRKRLAPARISVGVDGRHIVRPVRGCQRPLLTFLNRSAPDGARPTQDTVAVNTASRRAWGVQSRLIWPDLGGKVAGMLRPVPARPRLRVSEPMA